jgi:hypothetical protein
MRAGPVRFQRFKLIALTLASIRMKCQPCRTARTTVSSDSEPADTELSERSQHSGVEGSSSNSLEERPKPKPIIPARRNPVQEIAIPEENVQHLHQLDLEDSSDNDFDDYESALTLDPTNDPDIIPSTWTFNSSGMLGLSKNWSLWRDRGYRLQRRFYSMFRSHEPLLLFDHLLPYQPEASEEGERNMGSCSTSSKVPPSPFLSKPN